jgi:calcineurin-like phosphoesterase family protein
MKIYICSDLHFGHGNIIKYCNRPFSSKEDMDEKLVELFNEKVSDEDHVYHLGDFMFSRPKMNIFLELFERLPGKWHFILGNHDRHTLEKWKPQLLTHPRIEEIEHYKCLKYDGMFYILFHYEIKHWDGEHHGSHHFFGHSHSSSDRLYDSNSKDVGIDATNYQLLTIEEHVVELKLKKNLTNLPDELE